MSLHSPIVLAAFLTLSVSACAEEPKPAAPPQQAKPAPEQKDLITIDSRGEISTPQETIDAKGNVRVSGLNGMTFAPNGDIIGKNGDRLYDAATNRWLIKMSPAPASANGQAAGTLSATDLIVYLNTLTKGFNYAGDEFTRETVKSIGFEPSLGLLGITVDDVDETAPLTALIPVREVAVVASSFSRGRSVTDSVLLSCKAGDCITVTPDSFVQAIQKIRQGAGARPNRARSRSLFVMGCKVERCPAIRQALVDLAK